MNQLNFAVVGAGLAGSVHAEALTGVDQANLKVICDKDEKTGKGLAEEFGAEWCQEYSDLLDRDDVDVINICTPSSFHADMAIPAAENGKDLVIEKPLEITVEKCDRIIEAVDENQVTLSVIFQNRFKDAVQALRSAMDEERLGQLVFGDAHIKWYRDHDYYAEEGRGTKEFDGGGALTIQGIHTIDLLHWMMGEVKTVSGNTEALYHDIEVEDVGVANVQFENGALGSIVGSTAIYPGLDERLGVYGTQGTVEIDGNQVKTWEFEEEREDDPKTREIGKGKDEGGGSEAAGIGTENHRRQLEEITTAILEDRPPLVDGEEAKKSVAILEAIYESSRRGGEPVDFKEVLNQ